MVSETERFFENENRVKDYIETCADSDASPLIQILGKNLVPESSVLELGMGPGNHLNLLAEKFQVTGSDSSQVFLDFYSHRNPTADILRLDAVTIETAQRFDCIFSNKVLHHLSRADLKKSLSRQSQVVRSNGILFHTFWRGRRENTHQDLNFIKYEIDELIQVAIPEFEIIKIETYPELLEDDSIYMILKSK